jgi:hypothetical protein
MDDVLDVIEAFADGEPVDPARLNEALAHAQGRDHLIDILVLRGLVGGHTAARPGVMSTAGAAGSTRDVSRGAPRLGWARWLPAAAVIALIGGITGYVAGLHSTPALVQASKGVVVSSAPAPTQVFHLRDGADWTEKAGGN